LCRLLGEDLITREGRGYLSETGVPRDRDDVDRRPLFLRRIAPLYTYCFPVIPPLLLIGDLLRPWPPDYLWTFLFDVGVALILIAYTVFYFCWVRGGSKPTASIETGRRERL